MMDKSYWEVRRGSDRLAHGPKDTFPKEQERRILRSGGLKIYIEGKLYREGKC